MQIKRVNGGFEFDFRYCGKRIRKAVSAADLVHFLEGGEFSNPDANLPPGKEPISLYDFVEKFYLPYCSVHKKSTTCAADRITTRALEYYFGDNCLHQIEASHWEEYKKLRLAGPIAPRCKIIIEQLRTRDPWRFQPTAGAKPWSVNRELYCLNQIMKYAAHLKRIKENPVGDCKRLPTQSRAEFWLRKDQIQAFLANIPKRYILKRYPSKGDRAIYRNFAEFLILTGGRAGESILFHKNDIDWERREIKILTSKRKRSRDKVYRYLEIDLIGPKLISLLKRLVPHPDTGYYFYRQNGEPLNYPQVRIRLTVGARRAGLMWLRVHDLRHTFAMHRAIVIRDFRQLQKELGQQDPVSAQSYLDNTARFKQEDSIFFPGDPEWE